METDIDVVIYVDQFLSVPTFIKQQKGAECY